MGGRVSPNKCKTLSTSAEARAEYRKARYEGVDGLVPVETSMRDLGAHLSLATKKTASTLTQRIERGIAVLKRLQRAN
eukprot:8898524-Alexandrium_andersonii.AAC.1